MSFQYLRYRMREFIIWFIEPILVNIIAVAIWFLIYAIYFSSGLKLLPSGVHWKEI